MNNEFNKEIKKSFLKYLDTCPRSNEKLKILHGFLENKISKILGMKYNLYSLNLEEGKERKVDGKYMSKKVDICITNSDNEVCGAVSIKFIMSNYSQNSNNYFEQMLGETANIRSNNVPYFQVFIIENKIPYYNEKKNITKWEEISLNNISKYQKISFSNITNEFHIPNKMLLYICSKKSKYSHNEAIKNLKSYKAFYENNDFEYETFDKWNDNFGDNIIVNDLNKFLIYISEEIKK